jgi:hypothetical protein
MFLNGFGYNSPAKGGGEEEISIILKHDRKKYKF